jgi:hypothetical protein
MRKSQGKGSKGRKRWEKVAFGTICERIRNVQGLETLKDEAVTALAVALCLTCRYPPCLGDLVSKAKQALLDLDLWLATNREVPVFRASSKKFLDELESLRRILFACLKFTRSDIRHFKMRVEAKGATEFVEVKSAPSAEVLPTDEIFLSPIGSSTGVKRRQAELLILVMSVFREVDASNLSKRKSSVAPKADNDKANSMRTAAILDEFLPAVRYLAPDESRDSTNVRKQYRSALKTCAPLPTAMIKMLNRIHKSDAAGTIHAWFPVRHDGQ